jgi:hypothetical protein
MRRIQYLTSFFPHLSETIPRKKPIAVDVVLTGGFGKTHGPVSLRYAAKKTVKNIDNEVRRPTFDRNQNGSLYLEQP